MKGIIHILAVTIALASCTGSEEMSKSANNTKNTARKKTVCGKIHVDMNKPHLDWFEENNTVLNKSSEILVLPKDYKVYSVDTAQINAFFAAIKNNNTVQTVIPLPKPAECQLFTIKKHTNKEVDFANPDIQAKGLAQDQELQLIKRNGKVKAQVNWFDIKYEITTVDVEGLPYFVIYTKQPAPVNTTKKTNQPTKFEIIRPTYDK